MSDQLSNTEVAERLRLARESAGITQAAAARAIDVARTTLVAMEKGERRARTHELQQLARLYNTSMNALLRQEAVHVDLVPRFRRLASSSEDAATEAARLLADLVKAEVELENLLGIKRHQNYPPERPLLPGNVRRQAENDAAELRQWLGLGSAPVRDLISLLELELGVRVYIRPIDSRLSGLFAYDDQVGACMLLNGNHPRERRVNTAAHELGHFTSTRRQPEVLHLDEQVNSREETYANTFTREFLTPARPVMQMFQQLTAGAPALTRRHVITLAHVFGVSREAMVRRLEELSLTKPGTWDWFQANGGITNDQARQVLGDRMVAADDHAGGDHVTMIRLDQLAEEAWRRGLLSEGQLARLLHLDRIELRQILDSTSSEGNAADEMPMLPH